MENETIKIKKRVNYGIVSDSLLEDRRLSTTARLVAAWFEGRPVDWQIRRTHLIETLGISLKIWWSVRRELIEFGYLTHVRVRKSGRFIGSEIEFQIPLPVLPGTQKKNARSEQESVSMRVPTTLPFTTRGETTRGEGEHLSLQGPPTVLKQQPQPPARAVVVVDGNEGREAKEPVDHDEQPGQPLHWPPGLPQGLMVGVQGREQELLDEVEGRMASSTNPVSNPAGLLRHLVELAQAGTLVCELAGGVRAIREARQAHKMRLDQLSGAGGGSGSQRKDSEPKATTAPSAAALAARAALRAARQPGGRLA